MRGFGLFVAVIALAAPALAADDSETPAGAAGASTSEIPFTGDEDSPPLDDTSLGDQHFSSPGPARDERNFGHEAGGYTLQRPAADLGDVPVGGSLLTGQSFGFIGRQ